MIRARSIGFTVLVAGILLSFIIYAALGLSGVVEIKKKSTLEGRSYEAVPTLSVKEVASGNAQTAFEGFVSDHFPQRDAIMLANAGLQRSLIEIANIPFSFAGYPTFFGSQYAYLPGGGPAVFEQPSRVKDASEQKLAKAAKTYASLIERHGDVTWAFCMPDRSSITQASPLHDLIADPADYDFYKSALLDKLPGDCVVDASFSDTETFYSEYFHTDHHWQIEGTLKAYAGIMEKFGKTPLDFGEPKVVFAGPFWGSNARSGLCADKCADVIRDVDCPADGLKLTVDGADKKLTYLCEGFRESPGSFKLSDPFAAAYAQWFHSAKDALIRLDNENVPSGSLLIVGDSYSNNMERLFAQSFHTVWHVDPRYDTIDVDDFIDENDVDCVLILLNESFIATDTVLDNLSK